MLQTEYAWYWSPRVVGQTVKMYLLHQLQNDYTLQHIFGLQITNDKLTINSVFIDIQGISFLGEKFQFHICGYMILFDNQLLN